MGCSVRDHHQRAAAVSLNNVARVDQPQQPSPRRSAKYMAIGEIYSCHIQVALVPLYRASD